jgi:hypothetical protein
MFVSLCGYVYMSADSQRGQKRMSNPQELELETFVSSQLWVPGTGLRSSAGAVDALNHWAISPVIVFVCVIYIHTYVNVYVYFVYVWAVWVYVLCALYVYVPLEEQEIFLTTGLSFQPLSLFSCLSWKPVSHCLDCCSFVVVKSHNMSLSALSIKDPCRCTWIIVNIVIKEGRLYRNIGLSSFVAYNNVLGVIVHAHRLAWATSSLTYNNVFEKYQLNNSIQNQFSFLSFLKIFLKIYF